MGDEPAWVTQNLPLFGTNDGYAGEQSLSVDINLEELGFTVGNDWQSTFFYVSITPDPLSDIPTGNFEFANVKDTVWKFDDPAISGVAGSIILGQNAPQGHKAQGKATPIGPPRKMNPVEEDKEMCMPGAFARSLDWLNREYKLGYQKNAQEIYAELLKGGAGIRFPGDYKKSHAERIKKKSEYAKDKISKDIVTKIWDSKKDAVANTTGDIKQETWEHIDFITWLIQEYKNGEDVEIGSLFWFPEELQWRGHMETVTGLYQQGNKTYVDLVGDKVQGKQSGDETRGGLPLTKKGNHFYVGGGEVTFAVSESIPEPSTVVAVGGGIAYLVFRRKINRKANLCRTD